MKAYDANWREKMSKSDRSKGSIYDTLYVTRMIRENRSSAGKSSLGAANALDASQPRRGQFAALSTTSGDGTTHASKKGTK